MNIFFKGFILRVKALTIHIGAIAGIIVLHPDLLQLNVKSLFILACFVISGINQSAVSKMQERQ